LLLSQITVKQNHLQMVTSWRNIYWR